MTQNNVRTPEQTNEACSFLANHVQNLIAQTRGIEGYSDIEPAGGFLLPESDIETQEMLAARGIPYLSEGGVYSISEPDGGAYIGTLIHIPEVKRTALAASSDASRLQGSDVEVYCTLIEEVSHFTYTQWYYKTFGVLPHPAMLEFIGAIDKYNIFQREFVDKFGRYMNDGETDRVQRQVAAGYTPELIARTPGVYIIGHRLALDFLDYLNGLDRGIALAELDKVLKMKSGPQYRYLTRVCNLGYETFSEQERAEIEPIVSELEGNDLRRWK
jgi:hypothetical protein